MYKRLVSSCIAVAVSVMLLAPAAWSDDVTTPIASGAKAMLFTFEGLSTIGAGDFNGGVGGKYYLMDMLALRGSLEFGLTDKATPAPTGGSEGDDNTWDIGLSVGGEYHLLKTRVSPYVGAEIGFLATQTSSKNTLNPQTTTTGGDFAFNIAALGGVEFFIIKELSLSAEYRLGYTLDAPYDTKATTAGNPSVTVTTKNGATNSLGIVAAGALIMAFYF
ncbi:MAG TPA: outer membrane beta-barrel protein [Chitinivibrionales bacterium]|nr:outer membrane beta-barrel protein [Chitinivibrionales bacterium]